MTELEREKLTQELAVKENRLNDLLNKPKNIKSPGVTKKLVRQIRSIKNSLA